jgi:hypothetical protein
MARNRGLALGLVAIAAAAASVGSAATLLLRTGPSDARATGEDIYSRGIGPDGLPVPRSGGIVSLATGGCSACHSADGQGLRSARASAPNITYPNLTNPQGILLPNGKRGPSYTDQTLRRAATTGRTPGGSLSPVMPRWRLAGQEWAGLLAFLKTLR